jgi:NAD(P) transhydrogenase subunit alpha
MHFKQILVVKETRENERRVALTPKAVKQLTQKHYKVLVEHEAGLNAGFTNDDYIQAGAELFTLTATGFPSHTFIIRVLRPSKEREAMEYSLFHEHSAMLGFLFPFVEDDHIATWRSLGLTTLSFDLFKSISNDDNKNAQAAMSRIAGRLGLHDALKHYQGKHPIKLAVIGAGAAGLSSAYEAIKHNISVQVFGRKESLRNELEAAGIAYFVLPESIEEQQSYIRNYLPENNIIITAARIPGKKAPLLIDKEGLKILAPKTVVLDFAISNGGNVFGSKHDQVISIENEVLLLNVSGYPKRAPRESSETYAQCVVHLLTEIMSPEGELSFKNKWVQEVWVTHQNKRHEALYNTFENTKPSSL